MVLSGDRIYVLNQAGDMFVLKAAPKFELLATNSLGDGLTNSSPVVSDGQIFIRTHRHLWCIGKPAAARYVRPVIMRMWPTRSAGARTARAHGTAEAATERRGYRNSDAALPAAALQA
jgi:hypothetical protein